METFLITALVVVLVAGIPLAIWIGRLSKGKGSPSGGAGASSSTPPSPPAATPATPAPAPAPAPASSSAPKKKGVLGSVWFWIAAVVALVGIAVAILWYLGKLPSFNFPQGEETDGEGLSISIPRLSTFQWFIFGALLVLASWFILEKKKGLEWARNIALGAGTIIAILALVEMSTAWEPTANAVGDCIHTGMCAHDDSSGDTPVLHHGGSIAVPAGGRRTFYAEGRVRLFNTGGYCLNIAPHGVFRITWTSDGLTYYIEPRSGERELATVTSLHVGERDCV
jgi:hypothetical protein